MGRPDGNNAENYGETIRAFLNDPGDPRLFNAFFKVCQNHTKGYLYHLKKKGWRLRIHTNCLETDIDDLAIDTLSGFLSPHKGREFGLILEYYEIQDIPYSDPAVSNPSIYLSFLKLLRRNIHKIIPRLESEEDHQTAILKRRIKAILKSDIYLKLERNGQDFYYLRKNRGKLRHGKAIIDFEKLMEIALLAFYDSNTRVELCLKIFEQLDLCDDFSNTLPQNNLIGAVIKVNSQYVEFECSQISSWPSPEENLEHKAIQKAISSAIKKA
ncbi:MAG TPA: hypothetical protein ENO22_07300 [candidate division Zixibacteria bacterium]|nr:hypothetical protein [candidate division Zixibacteria bacterium]